MKILLIARPSDGHAAAVAWGLRQLGLQPLLWDVRQFPAQDRCTTHFTDTPRVSLRINDTEVETPFDVIWHRRLYSPSPPPDSAAADHKIITAEAKLYLQSVLPLLGHAQTRWVNHYTTVQAANDKAAQLILARRLGWNVPPTIMSNEAKAVRDFFKECRGTVIFKPFRGGGWYRRDGGSAVLKTAPITAMHLEHADAITACPGIFQQLIDKDFEVRVTVMGEHITACKILSQAQGATIDWRYEVKLDASTVQAHTLPPDVAQRCLRLCREMKLAFGCIDLIVDKNGDYIFLEVNESGQFLWKEDACPSLPMLELFCRFLAGDQQSKAQISIAKFDASPDGQRFLASVNRKTASGKVPGFSFE